MREEERLAAYKAWKAATNEYNNLMETISSGGCPTQSAVTKAITEMDKTHKAMMALYGYRLE